MQFLEDNHMLFNGSNNERRMIKINVLMSKCVKTRSPDQCRSHHQKMIKYHQDIPTIICHIRALLPSPTPTPYSNYSLKVEEEVVAKLEEPSLSSHT
jgi:hypothetical protein